MCALKDGYIDYGTCNTQYQTSVIRLSSCSYHCRDLQVLTLKNNNDFCTSHMRQYNFVVASNKLHPVLSNINFVSTSYLYLDEVNYSRQSFFLRSFFSCCFSIAVHSFTLMQTILCTLFTHSFGPYFLPTLPSILGSDRISQRRFNKTQHPIHGHHFSFCFFFYFFFAIHNENNNIH